MFNKSPLSLHRGLGVTQCFPAAILNCDTEGKSVDWRFLQDISNMFPSLLLFCQSVTDLTVTRTMAIKFLFVQTACDREEGSAS